LFKIIVSFIGDKYGTNIKIMTPSELPPFLSQEFCEPDLTKIYEIANRSFNSIFSTENIDSREIERDCLEAIAILERNRKQNHITKGGFANIALLVLLALAILFTLNSFAQSQNSSSDTSVFMWEQANSILLAATNETDYAKAADVYINLLKMGIRNGNLLYNTGTALLKAGFPSEAIKYFLQAELYLGANSELRNNMILAYRSLENNEEADLPWYRYFLFWHFNLSVAERAFIVAFAFSAFWISLTFIYLGGGERVKTFALLFLIIVILFGGSIIKSHHDYSSLSYVADYSQLTKEKAQIK